VKTAATKICTKCDRELPVVVFTKNTGAPDGLGYHCKLCTKFVRASTTSPLWKRKKRTKPPGTGRNFVKSATTLRIEELERALPDPKKLRDLAMWLDIKFPNDGDEVQRDLRRWASLAESATPSPGPNP